MPAGCQQGDDHSGRLSNPLNYRARALNKRRNTHHSFAIVISRASSLALPTAMRVRMTRGDPTPHATTLGPSHRKASDSSSTRLPRVHVAYIVTPLLGSSVCRCVTGVLCVCVALASWTLSKAVAQVELSLMWPYLR